MSSEALSLLTAPQLFPPRGLVGEQSNAYRILLRYDRKSRHRRIKKQRRYERLAATSQFLCTRASNRSYVTRGFRRPAEYASTRSLPLRICGWTPSRVRVARTLSTIIAPTPYRALNRSTCYSRLGCGLSLGIEIFTLATGVTYSLVLALL